MSLNIVLFKKVRDRIAAIPNGYDQETYYRPDGSAPCGTACCIAGESIICNAASVEDGVNDLRFAMRAGTTPNVAAHLLGILKPRQNYYEQDYDSPVRRLFAEDPQNNWPEPFSEQWRKARSRKARAAIAVAYLDHIIETGKVLE